MPRLSPPLRLTSYKDSVGGITGVQFIFLAPEGKHGFATPDPAARFDLGTLLGNQLGRYAGSAGTKFSYEACQTNDTCPWIEPLPK